MKIGYARVSTKRQAAYGNSLDGQEETLRSAGAEKIYREAFTGTKMHRPELDQLMQEITEGDTLIVTKLDRIARTAMEGFQLIKELIDRKITVHVLNIGIIDTSPTGKLLLQVMLAFAEFERDMIIERTQEGRAIAKEGGKLVDGRPPKFSREHIQHAVDLCQQYTIPEVVRMTGISKSTIMRAKRKIKADKAIKEIQRERTDY